MKIDKACALIFTAICIAMVAFNQPFGAAWFGFCAGAIFERVHKNGRL